MSSTHYFARGFKLIFQPGIRWLVLTPLFINLLIYILMIWWLFDQFGLAVDWALNQMPTWLSFLAPVMWTVFSLSMLLVFGYSFAILAAIIGSPFNGLLAEKIAEQTGKRNYATPLNTKVVATLIRRSLKRELVKLGYFFPRIIAALIASVLLGFIPLIGLIVTALVFLWAAWSMCIQYVDYPADNDEVDFKSTLARMGTNRFQSIVFGASIVLVSGIPLVNLFAMPAAVAGATLFWVEQLSE